MLSNRPARQKRLLRRTLVVAAMCSVVGSWAPVPEGVFATESAEATVSRFAAASGGDSASQESRKPETNSDSATESQAPRSPRPHEKPRRKKSLEIGIGEEEAAFPRRRLA
jgi:hypothetical protein